MSLDKINSLLEYYRENCTEMLANSLQRWRGYNKKPIEGYNRYKKDFNSSLVKTKTYFVERPNYTLIHMKEFFNLTGDFYELTIKKEGKGKIMVNSILPNFVDNKWVGRYFYSIPVKIKAIPLNNYTFKEWNGDYTSNKTDIYISLEKPMTIKAIFNSKIN